MKRHLKRSMPLLAFALLSATAFAERDFNNYPRSPIDPAQGVQGDAGFSGTIEHWGTEDALNASTQWIGDPDNEWKLNWKFMDLDRADLHPGHLAVDEGQALVELWERREPGFVACLSGGGTSLEGVAARYPRFDESLGRIMTVESLVEHCDREVVWQGFKQGSKENTVISLYIKSLSAGTPINVDLASKPMMEAYGRGEATFYKRVGQLNFACASCHTPGGVMGHKLRGEIPTTPFGDAAHFPTYRSAVGELEPLHVRFTRCLKQMRAAGLPPGDPAYVDLEVFYTVLSNGYPISVPSAR